MLWGPGYAGKGKVVDHRDSTQCTLVVSLSTNPIGDIGSGYPTNVYDGNRLSRLILRQ
jgi:hypothetical protein